MFPRPLNISLPHPHPICYLTQWLLLRAVCTRSSVQCQGFKVMSTRFMIYAKQEIYAQRYVYIYVVIITQ